MPRTVDEIMNPELFSLKSGDSPEEALGYLLALGISSAPVLDPSGKPVGHLSFRDVLAKKPGISVADRMTHPALSVRVDTTIDEAARWMAEHNLHHAVVVRDDGFAVGMLSAVDVLKALCGMPVNHPESFPNYDANTGICWTEDAFFDLEHADIAPDGPGILALIYARPRRKDAIVWSEACNNVRTRIYEMLSIPQAETPMLARILSDRGLRFRAALVPDVEARARALHVLLEASRLPVPQNATIS